MNNKMAINIDQQLNLKNKINEQAEQKQTHKYREHCEAMGKNGEGIKRYKLVVTEYKLVVTE